jgi:hypothetical protein
MAEVYWGEPGKADQSRPLEYLLTFARHHELIVTSGEHVLPDGTEVYPHEGHNTHSLHYRGRAIDVSVRGLLDATVEHICRQAALLGINAFDERQRPKHGVWTGPHLHLSISPPGTREL